MYVRFVPFRSVQGDFEVARLILVIMAGHLSVRLRFESHYQNAQSNPESVKSPVRDQSEHFPFPHFAFHLVFTRRRVLACPRRIEYYLRAALSLPPFLLSR
jgi:hypothetical protein